MAEIDSRLATALKGRYSIEDRVGQGGMATVFRAHDLKHDRPVALKVLDPDLAAVIGSERFVREIRVTARLVHPHILPLLDSGEADGLLYYSMPLVSGRSLREETTSEPPSVQKVVRIVSQIAAALDLAHAQGIVHRDVKPENILVERGDVLVADFGIAAMIDAGEGERLTATGLAIGTTEYMSPEQVSGLDVDKGSDVYSLACVAYELFAGRPVFVGSVQAVARQHLTTDPIPLSTLRSILPTEVDVVFRRALAKDRTDRYGTAGEFAAALRQAVEAPARARPRRRRRVALGVTAIGVASLLMATWIAWNRSPRTAIDSVAVLPLEDLSVGEEQAYFAAGLHDNLISELQRLSAFDRVTSRTSMMQYRNPAERPPLPRIASALVVDALLEGSVTRVLDEVTVRLRLVTVEPEERVVWDQDYTGDAADVMTLSRRATGDIAEFVALSLTPREQARLADPQPIDPDAYDAYLRGRAEWDKRSAEGFRLAADYFGRAIAIDSGYAAAWAGLSDSYSLLGQYSDIDLALSRQYARSAAERAILADSTSAEALVSLAEVHFASREWTQAEQRYRQALRMNPGLAQGHHFYGWFLTHLGRYDEALEHLERAQELDPLAPTIAADRAGALFYARRWDDAQLQVDRALDLQPDLRWGLWLGSLLAIRRGEFDRAEAYADGWEAAHPDYDGRVHAHVWAAAGREEEMRALVRDQVDRLGGRELVDPLFGVALASAYATLGDVEEAIAWLRDAVDGGYAAGAASLLGWPPFDPLIGEPRYEALLERMGYPR